MKRSKIFLGITTAILAVAGVTAAKHYGPSISRFYVTSAGNYCKAQVSVCTKVNGGSNPCNFSILQPFYTKGPEGLVSVNPSACTSQLFYNLEH